MIRFILFVACLIMLFKAPGFAIATFIIWMFVEGLVGIATYIIGRDFAELDEHGEDYYD